MGGTGRRPQKQDPRDAGAPGGDQNGLRRHRLFPVRGAPGREVAETAWIETVSNSEKTETGVGPEGYSNGGWREHR